MTLYEDNKRPTAARWLAKRGIAEQVQRQQRPLLSLADDSEPVNAASVKGREAFRSADKEDNKRPTAKRLLAQWSPTRRQHLEIQQEEADLQRVGPSGDVASAPPARSPPDTAPIIDLASILQISWGYRRMIAIAIIACAIALGGFTLLLHNKYTATTTIYFDPTQIRTADNGEKKFWSLA